MVYDYMNRRVKRTLYDWTGSAWSGTPAESRIFLYDGWNVLLSYNPAASMAIDREFTWGLDVSGQNGNPSVAGIHGAGGIGGLVAARRVGSPTKAYFCFYDANGNLSDCVKNSDGTPWTHVEYDPYGGPIVASDAGGLGHPFRYSTKYWDGVFEQYYYGHRCLDHRLGRWTVRDPAGESADENLYTFVQNRPTVEYDVLGLWNDDMHEVETRNLAMAVMSAECANRIAKWNIGVDRVTGAALFPQFHFDLDADGNPFPRGRDWWYRHRWTEGNQLLANAKNCHDVRRALNKIGEALHSFQDGYSHQASGTPHAKDRLGHMAATPFDHAPSVFCLLWGDPFGIVYARCRYARQNNPNWHNPHRPDDAASFWLDWDRTSRETGKLLNSLNSHRMMQCCCPKGQSK